MMNEAFWNKVLKGAEKLGIPVATVRVWKTRKSVPHSKRVSIFDVLKGSEHEIKLSDFQQPVAK